MKEILQEKGFWQCNRVPYTKSADEMWQKNIQSDGLGIDFYLTVLVFHPTDYSSKTTAEFELQIDHDEAEADHSMRVKMFNFDAEALSGRKLDNIIQRSRNIYKYLQYV